MALLCLGTPPGRRFCASARPFGFKMPQPEVNFLGAPDIENILALADFETIKVEWCQLLPKQWFGLGTLVNRYIATATAQRHGRSGRHRREKSGKIQARRLIAPQRA
jgi:hypothetical protein